MFTLGNDAIEQIPICSSNPPVNEGKKKIMI